MKYVVLGGGIAGVCCLEELINLVDAEEDSLTLVSGSKVLKGVQNVHSLTEHVEEFEIVEKPASAFPFRNLKVIQGSVNGLNLDAKEVMLTTGDGVPYDKLCICLGARPKMLHSSSHVLTLRDVHSVRVLQEKLSTARRAMVVGNGGIALDLMSSLRGFDLIWVLKHEHVGEAFFDRDAATFILDEFSQVPKPTNTEQSTTAAAQSSAELTDCIGEAVGPNWTRLLSTKAPTPETGQLTIEAECQVDSIEDLDADDSHNVRVKLTNGHQYDVDVVVTAVGVDPSLSWVPEVVERCEDGGLRVNAFMQTNVSDVYAAGDCCTVDWGDEIAPHWFQMRLWTQAKRMGIYAAQCMAGVADGPGIAFELFTHVTKFLDKKVILLGRYHLETDDGAEVIVHRRVMDVDGEQCYGKVIIQAGRVQGAVLIGRTELEETLENLILDGLDVSGYHERLLDPEIDHVFD